MLKLTLARKAAASIFFGCCGGRRSSTLICQPCLRSAGDLLRLRLKFRDRAKPYIFLDALRPGVDVGNLVWWLALGCVLHAQIQFRLAKRIGKAASMFLIARVVQIASSMWLLKVGNRRSLFFHVKRISRLRCGEPGLCDGCGLHGLRSNVPRHIAHAKFKTRSMGRDIWLRCSIGFDDWGLRFALDCPQPCSWFRRWVMQFHCGLQLIVDSTPRCLVKLVVEGVKNCIGPGLRGLRSLRSSVLGRVSHAKVVVRYVMTDCAVPSGLVIEG